MAYFWLEYVFYKVITAMDKMGYHSQSPYIVDNIKRNTNTSYYLLNYLLCANHCASNISQFSKVDLKISFNFFCYDYKVIHSIRI